MIQFQKKFTPTYLQRIQTNSILGKSLNRRKYSRDKKALKNNWPMYADCGSIISMVCTEPSGRRLSVEQHSYIFSVWNISDRNAVFLYCAVS